MHNDGLENWEISKKLKIGRSGKNKVKHTIDRYNETGSLQNRRHKSHKRSKRTPKMIKALKERIRRNPCRKKKKLAMDMGVSIRTMHSAIKEDLDLKAYTKKKCQYLSDSNKLNRFDRCAKLLKRYGKKSVENILFTDEKIFTIEEKSNKQNDKVYGKLIDKKHLKITRSHSPSQVMVWAGISMKGKTPIHFVEPGVKMNAVYYKEKILEKIVMPLNHTLFNGEDWTFQQDSAPPHKAKTTQAWLKNFDPDFINSQEWPPASPDLNPLDYSIWSILDVF